MSAAWTSAEDKELENALQLIPDGADRRWEKIAERLPGRSAQEVEEHYINVLLQHPNKEAEAPPPPPRPWTRAECKECETALVLIPEGTDGRWEKIADMLPGRSAQEVEQYYQDLVLDVARIENDIAPEYNNIENADEVVPPLDAAGTSDADAADDDDDGAGGEGEGGPQKRQKTEGSSDLVE